MAFTTAVKKHAQVSKKGEPAKPARVIKVSMKGIPAVNAEGRARLQAAAKVSNPSGSGRANNYPRIVIK